MQVAAEELPQEPEPVALEVQSMVQMDSALLHRRPVEEPVG